ncbi:MULTISPECIES: type II secretion system F family protein [Stenotrophomonas]|jgi:tight adherence protein C|uniref:Type II secretion system F family protein n=1 Tax=Stenotrophomonas lactitubi TaxID=2045214 RepID=A0AAW4GD06_9GAMM|nr:MULTISPECIES: type II secretion system F family protein [Stenotrophomonas]HED4874812.1 type II secretion system F family protein [Stenotrophomonas maltophilia]MBM9911866.1 type II secretion system F family protein [Stenotrophomonas lactitubi]MBM9921096.1 type II secretion system F family protein [Stenotrophomonas lactitubi]MBM9939246.1 type II secretion system F family protein [Stenotrophomonas lactitubi]NYU00406.1 type II secretion system F family protein [Stenotrophomonas sp. SbOxS2]
MSASIWFVAALLVLAAGVALLGLGSWVRSHREDRSAATLKTALRPRENEDGAADARKDSLGWLEQFGRGLSGGRLEAALLAGEDRLLLDLAGWNTRRGTAIYLGLRLLLAVLVLGIALAISDATGLSRIMVVIGALAAGLLLPKFALSAWVKRRRRAVNNELPLLIDLLRLLQGVGFSMDQSLQTLGDKLRDALPVLGGEIQEANVSYTHGRTRAQSLRRLSDVYGDDDLSSLVQLILQVHAHGGAVQEPLRQFSIRLREQRRNALKEKVGKLSVKMTVVMMLTLLPALMLVLAGPALVALATTLSKMG